MRLVDADKLKEDVLDLPNCPNEFSDTYDKARILDLVDEQSAVDAEPVNHGHWRYDEALELEWCSECGFGKRKGDKRWYSYCPNCGAYMEVKDGKTDLRKGIDEAN